MSIIPGLLFVWWVALRVATTAVLAIMGPLGLVWAPILSLLFPYAAVVMALSALVTQAYFCCLPLGKGIAALIGDLGDVIEAAFTELVALLPKTISALLAGVGVPERFSSNVVKALFAPLQEGILQVINLIPRADEIFPEWAKEPYPLVPFIWAGLLTGLFCAQALMLITIGMSGKGDLAIVFSLLLCYLLGMLAFYADKIMPTLLWVIESVINTAVQFLLRKVIVVDKLQAGIDMAIRAVEFGAKAAELGAKVGEEAIVRAAKPTLDKASVPVLHGSLVKQINGGIGSG